MNYTPHNFEKLIEVTGNNNVVLKDIYPKVLYFTAKWCGPCQRISPIYKELADKRTDIKFFKIDVDKNEELSAKFNISSMPTFIFFKSKTDFKFFSGADTDKLKQHINWLSS